MGKKKVVPVNNMDQIRARTRQVLQSCERSPTLLNEGDPFINKLADEGLIKFGRHGGQLGWQITAKGFQWLNPRS